MIVSLFELPARYKFGVMAVLLGLVGYITYYYHSVLGASTVFTHLYYIPIVLACIWWKKRGLAVVILLALMLLFSHHLFRSDQAYANNLMRVFMFFLVAMVSILLSEGIAMARQRADENRHWYETIFQKAGTAMAILAEDALIDVANAEFEHLTGYAKDEMESTMSLFDLMPQGKRRNVSIYYYHTKKEKFFRHNFIELKLLHKSGQKKHVQLTLALIPGTNRVVASLADLTALTAALEEQKQLKAKLAGTLTKVLSGYLPICARCKKIRDESGQWNVLETYIHSHTEADFTHTLCPQCARELYPDLIDDNEPLADDGSGNPLVY